MTNRLTGAAKASQDMAARRCADAVAGLVTDLSYYHRHLRHIFESPAIDAELVDEALMDRVLSDIEEIIAGCNAQVSAAPPAPAARSVRRGS